MKHNMGKIVEGKWDRHWRENGKDSGGKDRGGQPSGGQLEGGKAGGHLGRPTTHLSYQ